MAEGPSRNRLLALLAVFAVVWFCNLGYRHLIRPDEGRYAEIAREMVASGDWLTPRLNGFKYFEKPALQYWATAAALTAFGKNEWAARLWPGLTGFLGVLLVFFAGRRLFGPPAALYGAAVDANRIRIVQIVERRIAGVPPVETRRKRIAVVYRCHRPASVSRILDAECQAHIMIVRPHRAPS